MEKGQVPGLREEVGNPPHEKEISPRTNSSSFRLLEYVKCPMTETLIVNVIVNETRIIIFYTDHIHPTDHIHTQSHSR